MQKIKETINIEIISSLNDIIKLNQFIFSLVPVPLNESMRTKLTNIKLQQLPVYFELWKNCMPDTHGHYGNWCGFHAKLMIFILKEVYGFRTCNFWGCGLKRIANHVAVMITFKGKKYTFDPYFGIHYEFAENNDNSTYNANKLIPFNTLITLIKQCKFGQIKIVFAPDNIKKNIMRNKNNLSLTDINESSFIWIKMNSNEFYNHIMDLFKKQGFFNNDTILSLLSGDE